MPEAETPASANKILRDLRDIAKVVIADQVGDLRVNGLQRTGPNEPYVDTALCLGSYTFAPLWVEGGIPETPVL